MYHIKVEAVWKCLQFLISYCMIDTCLALIYICLHVDTIPAFRVVLNGFCYDCLFVWKIMQNISNYSRLVQCFWKLVLFTLFRIFSIFLSWWFSNVHLIQCRYLSFDQLFNTSTSYLCKQHNIIWWKIVWSFCYGTPGSFRAAI